MDLTFGQKLWTKDDQCYAWQNEENLDTVAVIWHVFHCKNPGQNSS